MKRRVIKRIAALIAVMAVMTATLPSAALAAETAAAEDIVILYSGDVHGQADENLGYAGLAAYRNDLLKKYRHVAAVDTGDAVSGSLLASVSRGEYSVEAMNLAGYTVSVPGVHDFDFGVSHFINTLAKDAAFSYISCNFVRKSDSSRVFDAYKMVTYGNKKVAYIGISDPQTIAKSPVSFGGAYSFCDGNNGQDLYNRVQAAINDAKAKGADYIIALGHLTSEALSPYSAVSVIQNTSGIHVMIQGNTHYESVGGKVRDMDGNTVLLTCPGSGLEYLGVLTIKSDNTAEAKLVSSYNLRDIETKDGIDALKASYNADLAKPFASTSSRLEAVTSTGVRTIDRKETNLGDLVADAYRAATGADLALVESGEIRTSLAVGDISYKDVMRVLPEGRALSVVRISGADIMDALEMAARLYPNSNAGSFQISGLTYDVQETVIPSVAVDTFGKFSGINGEYRVTNIMIEGKPLDLFATYTLAGTEELLSGSTGYTMFENGVLSSISVTTDSQALIDYLGSDLGGVVGGLYAKSQNRMDVIRLARQSEIDKEVEAQVADQMAESENRISELEKQLKQKNEALEVKGVVITASSKFGKTSGKRYIRISWTVSDDADGMKYQVWKSSKKGSGYRKVTSTSKLYYKNTTGLTKGKTYYYKVRGYKSIGGKYYYTNWSNKVSCKVTK